MARPWATKPCRCSRCLSIEELPGQEAGRGGRGGVGRGADARREARVPQRAGHGARADRHDRPGHGLRHDRIEPDFALVKFKKLAGAAISGSSTAWCRRRSPRSATARSRPRRSSATRWSRHAGRRARNQPPDACREGFRRRHAGLGRIRARLGLRHQVRVQQMDARRELLRRPARPRRRALSEPGFDLLATLGFSRVEIDAATPIAAAR